MSTSAATIDQQTRSNARETTASVHSAKASGAINLEHVAVEFSAHTGRRAAVADFELAINPGEFVCLLGPSGCGKSTLLNCVAGFVQPSQGRVVVDGVPVDRPAPERGVVFQQYSLFPWKSVVANVAFGPFMAGHSRRQAHRIALEFLALVGLSAYANHYPAALSGGMQQRVGIARALANNPTILLMDEPFGALDAQSRAIMQENLLDIWERFGTSIMFVTHDVDEAIFLADRVVIMSAAPGRTLANIKVNLPRPRPEGVLTDRDFLAIKRECLSLIRQETLRAFNQQNEVV